MLNILPTSTVLKRLQYLPQDLPRVAAKKWKCQSPTLSTASGKPAKKSLSNPKVLTLRVEPEQESILSNIFIHPLELPTTTSFS